MLSLMIASGSSSRSLRSKWICSGSFCLVWPGYQQCGRNHADVIVGGAIGPPVMASAASSSQ